MEENLQFLQCILSSFLPLENQSIKYTELFYKTTGIKIEVDKSIFSPGVTSTEEDAKAKNGDEIFGRDTALKKLAAKFDKALELLKDDKMIRENNGLYSITYYGILQYNKSYVKEYKRKNFDRKLNNFYLIYSAISGLIGILTGAFIKDIIMWISKTF